MKRTFLLLAAVVLALACDTGDNAPLGNPSIDCPKNLDLSFPRGAEINTLSKIEFDGELELFSWVGEEDVYALGNQEDHTALFKSSDAGVTWTNLNLTYPSLSRDMLFLNDTLGIITLDGPHANLLITRDGKNWDQREYPNLEGTITNLHKDQGRLYAILNEAEGIGKIIISIDQAESWYILNSTIGEFHPKTFKFTIHEERMYRLGEKNSIIVSDTRAITNEVIDPQVGFIWDVKVIDHNIIIVTGVDKTVKTIDGGENWSELYDDDAHLIDFQNVDQGLMLFKKGLCQSGDFRSNDTFAITEDGGLTWLEGDEVTNLSTRYKDSYSLDSKCVLLIGNTFYSLSY